MQVPYRVYLLGVFETSLILFVLLGHGAFLLSLLTTVAGVDVTPGIAAAHPAPVA